MCEGGKGKGEGEGGTSDEQHFYVGGLCSRSRRRLPIRKR